MSLPPEVRANYTTIIDSILATSDITQISEKRIRKGIQEAVEYDITPQKAAIKELILERFDIFSAKANAAAAPIPSVETSPAAPITNGYHNSVHAAAPSPSKSATAKSTTATATPPKRENNTDELSDVIDSAPPKKKRKGSVDDDAVLAARLQAEEDKLSRPRRGGAPRRAAPVKKKKTPKKKTEARVKAEDDSDIDSSEVDGEKPIRNTGFHKPLNLSPALSDLLGGETSLSRPQMTKKMWIYIKSNGLQDPADKRFIICDDKMRSVFKTDKVHMFTMTKILNQHLYNPEE